MASVQKPALFLATKTVYFKDRLPTPPTDCEINVLTMIKAAQDGRLQIAPSNNLAVFTEYGRETPGSSKVCVAVYEVRINNPALLQELIDEAITAKIDPGWLTREKDVYRRIGREPGQ